jgi:hypothetical protein
VKDLRFAFDLAAVGGLIGPRQSFWCLPENLYAFKSWMALGGLVYPQPPQHLSSPDGFSRNCTEERGRNLAPQGTYRSNLQRN